MDLAISKYTILEEGREGVGGKSVRGREEGPGEGERGVKGGEC